MRYFSALLLIICFSSITLFSASKTALFLHSYNNGLAWTDNLNNTIYTELKNYYGSDLDIRIEYMDTKRFEDSAYLKHFSTYLLTKYKDVNFDIIISTDNAAYEFLKNQYNGFVKSVPVVSCGVNFVNDMPSGFTGLIEDIDVQSNLKCLTSLHPDYNKVYIINDKSITGSLVHQQTLQVIENNFPDLRYTFITDIAYEDLKQKLTTLKDGDIVLLLIFNYDKNGLTIPYDDILDDIKPYCKVPIYGVWDFYLGKGIVGGKITSAYYHATKTAEIAKKVLDGAPTDQLKLEPGPTKYMFDYNELKAFDIDWSLLPEQRLVINRPSSVILENKILFSLIFLAITFLILWIVFLSKSNVKRKNILEKEREYHFTIEEKNKALKLAIDDVTRAHQLQQSFFANISHEIRTPLNSILGFTDIMDIQEKNSKENKEYIKHINENGNRLLHLMDNLIEISKIDSGLLTVNKSRFNVCQLLNEMYPVFVNLKKELKLVLKFPEGGDILEIYSDKVKLEAILKILLDNAYKFTQKGYVEYGFEFSEDGLSIFVKDSGIGIPKEELAYVFECFGQVEKGYSRSYQGSGLGLPIAKAYIEALGAKPDLKSTLGKGTVFSFLLPLSEIESNQS